MHTYQHDIKDAGKRTTYIKAADNNKNKCKNGNHSTPVIDSMGINAYI